MEKQLSYVPMPSLEQMALRRIAVAFYSDPRILAQMAALKLDPLDPRSEYPNIWEPEGWSKDDDLILKWRRTVKDKASTLPLPESLAKLLMPLLKAVGSSIFTWKSIHEKYFSASYSRKLEYRQKLCWTSVGAVDYRRTAEQLVRCDVLGTEERFELACLYCLERYIPFLWEKFPDQKKRSFCDARVETPHLQSFLTCILRKQSRIPSGYTWAASNSFEEAALLGNKTLAEYCFGQLTKEEREASLVRTAKNVIRCRKDRYDFDFRREKLSDVLCYLLSLMTPEEQMGIFQELPCEVLRCFLDWPWQDLFPDIADVIWTFLPESKYDSLVRAIYISISSSGYYFPNVFQNLFLRSPREFRKHFVESRFGRRYFLWRFFIEEDTETIRVILRNVDAADRVRLVFSEDVLEIIFPVRKWPVKEVILREATLSKEDRERLKESFVALLERRGRIQWARVEHWEFFQFLEEAGAEEPGR